MELFAYNVSERFVSVLACVVVILSTCSHVLSVLLKITTISARLTGETVTSGSSFYKGHSVRINLKLGQIQQVPTQMLSELVGLFALHLNLW